MVSVKKIRVINNNNNANNNDTNTSNNNTEDNNQTRNPNVSGNRREKRQAKKEKKTEDVMKSVDFDSDARFVQMMMDIPSKYRLVFHHYYAYLQ